MSNNNYNKQPLDLTDSNVEKSDDEAIGFLLDCAERGQTRRKQRPPSICKVPRILRDLSESSFIPQLVSIGPIHRDDPKLKEFEWQKECYLYDLLNRFRSPSTPKETLEACLREVNTLIPQIRESYAGVKNYSDVELARMMVIDGCFILEFCFKHEEGDLELLNTLLTDRIAMDLILLENQVPFVVLQALIDCLAPYKDLFRVLDTGLEPYINIFCVFPEKKSILSNVHDKFLAPYIKLFSSLLPERNSTTDPENISTCVDSNSTPAHVLGYLHKRYQLVAAKSRVVNAAFHSIVELDRSGMNFKPHQEDVWSMTIKFQSSLFSCLPWFWGKPTLLMPTLVIHDFTELILRNLIAYEQSFRQDRDWFTSYAVAMDMLIDTQEDVAILAESKVLFNKLFSNREAADMINKIGKNIFVTDFLYTNEFKQMDKYCNGFWPKIKRIYFRDPWNAINLRVGIIVSLATVVAAIFAILDYFR